jgi:hypothetical protein
VLRRTDSNEPSLGLCEKKKKRISPIHTPCHLPPFFFCQLYTNVYMSLVSLLVDSCSFFCLLERIHTRRHKKNWKQESCCLLHCPSHSLPFQ